MPSDLETAYKTAHARAVRLAYAVAGAIEDYPMPVGTVPDWSQICTLRSAANQLCRLLQSEFGIPEPPANLPEAS